MASLSPHRAQRSPAKPEEKKAARGKAAAPKAAKPSSSLYKPAYLQTKLRVSQPGDAEERQADQVAKEVSRAPRDQLHRASLEPAITPPKRDESLAPKRARQPVPSAERIARAPATSDETSLRRQADEEPAASTTDSEEPSLDTDSEARIDARRGQGETLPETIRAELESQFNHDFSSVRIHTDAEAAQLCAQVSARAFTVGNDIFFAPGEYAPSTEAGRELLAHELTHVVQQGSGASRALWRKEEKPEGDGPEHVGKRISNLTLKVPGEYTAEFKQKAEDGLVHHRNYDRDAFKTNPREVWKDALSKTALTESVKLLKKAPGFKTASDGKYLFEVPSRYAEVVEDQPGKSTLWLLGSLEECAVKALIPEWDANGSPKKSAGKYSYDVDHKVDLQFGAKDQDKFQARDDFEGIDNLRLLEADLNRNAKNAFLNESMDKALEPLAKKENEDGKTKKKKVTPSQLRAKNNLVFNAIEPGAKLAKNANQFWTREEIDQGEHLSALLNANPKQIYVREPDFAEKLAKKDELIIFHSESGGFKNTINVKDQKTYQDLLKPFVLEASPNKPDNALIRFKVSLPKGAVKGAIKTGPINGTLDIEKLDNSEKLGYFPREKFSLMMGLRKFSKGGTAKSPLEKTGMSPISVDDWGIAGNKGMTISGQILPSLPMLKNSQVDFEITGNDLTFSKTFNTGELSLPEPFHVDDCSLTVSAGTSGKVMVNGQVDFAVDRLGQGYLRGIAGSDELSAEGEFNFDSKMFDRALIKIWYREEQLGAEGEIGIDSPNKVRGIKSGHLNMKYEQGQFDASGAVVPDIPGIERADFKASYSDAAGLMMAGKAQLKSSPLLRSGQVDITVRQLADAWKVSATGKAQPAIPGIDSDLNVSYADGAFLAEFNGAFQRGMLAGNASVGVTNRTVGADGLPSGEPLPGAPLIVYGSGAATVKLAPWLQGTAGIRFAPNGEVTVNGQIGLPSQVEIFPRKQLDKHLFGIDMPIPIVPGIFAEIGGGLDAQAGIGPGVIDRLQLGIEYNPAHEEDTHVTGDGHVNVPADAGLRLSVHGGIGLGIPGVSVSGGLEVGGKLGVAGAAEAGVHVDWTPARGLGIEAYGRISAQPQFVFDVSGYVEAEALFFTVYENRWRLAQFEYGSDLTFGVNFPIHYQQGEPFDIALSDVEFQVPEVSPRQILTDLVDRIA